ncbi:VOC family protein [Variovorax sp. Varisp62]|uniref:VOC family protein n=1 Tax=Variovorax sp. Varisp62 TaxID=3243049 RepID=UPI0039B527E3
MKITHLALLTRDVQLSADFYKSLGLVPLVEGPGYARLRSVELETTLSLIDATEVAPSGATIYFEVADVDSEVQRLKGLGIGPVEPAKDQPWGWREARYRDPSGYAICLFWGGTSRLNPKLDA